MIQFIKFPISVSHGKSLTMQYAYQNPKQVRNLTEFIIDRQYVKRFPSNNPDQTTRH
jgi:hypothetical protein